MVVIYTSFHEIFIQKIALKMFMSFKISDPVLEHLSICLIRNCNFFFRYLSFTRWIIPWSMGYDNEEL